ncbi:hypothetical protein NDA07_01010 [Microcoleus vaginatus DQ-U2]|uniref:hypothetical protein n=1 Tax=Microcoleus vaginatus TaxID=119532 RepID=UPI001687698F|nr:hypothetical protein [Microcoleus sp. FACHB-DQ6]
MAVFLIHLFDRLNSKKNHYRESANCGDRPWAAIEPFAMAPYTLIPKDFSHKFQLALSRQ